VGGKTHKTKIMNTLKSIVVIFFIISISSCKKDEPIQDRTNELYTAFLKSTRNNGKISLHWEKPSCPFICQQLEPDHFEVLMSSSDPSKLELYAVVSNKTFDLMIDNLINGTPYYFAIKAIGVNKKFTVSKIIMTIPDKPENIQTLFQTADKNRELGSWSPDQSSLTYVSDYTWNNGNNLAQSVFLYSVTNNREWLIETSSRSPEWCPRGQKIVYHTDNGEVNSSPGYRPTHIAVYDVQDSSIKRLTAGNSFNYLPSWSEDGNWIAFLSDKAGSKEYNIWKVSANGGTAIQITSDFNDLIEMSIDDRSPKTLSWSKDGSSIAFACLKKSSEGYDYDIYSVPSNGGRKTIIINSQWSDFCPSYSPDGATLAFISNRSGSNEIWTMNLLTKQFRQITGSTGKWIYENSGKIEWSASSKKILFTSNADSFNTLYSVDIN
jgi:Tol biopolymer transport system component